MTMADEALVVRGRCGGRWVDDERKDGCCSRTRSGCCGGGGANRSWSASGRVNVCLGFRPSLAAAKVVMAALLLGCCAGLADAACQLTSSDISAFPVSHNCSSFAAGEVCVATCDINHGYEGDASLTITCGSGDVIVPFTPLACTKRDHEIVTDPSGIHLIAYQGDVYARVGSKAVGIHNVDTRLRGAEEHVSTLNEAVGEMLDASVPSQVATLQAAVEAARLEAAQNISHLRSDLEGALDARVHAGIVNATAEASLFVDAAHADLSSIIANKEASLASEIEATADGLGDGIAIHASKIASLESAVSGHEMRIQTIETSDNDGGGGGSGGSGGGGNCTCSGSSQAAIGRAKERPGVTCSHILAADEEAENGMYWIDPNGGLADDAVRVFCNMSGGGWTFVPPSSAVPFENHRTSGPEVRDWWSGPSFGGERFQYEMPDDQLRALVNVSNRARQRALFTCKGSVIWGILDNGNIVFDPQLTAEFRGYVDDSYLWNRFKSAAPSPHVPHDGCAQNAWNQKLETVFEFETEDPAYLPITDIKFKDDDSGESWGFEYEAVQFKTTALALKPRGRSCSHIHNAFPTAPSGAYLIDPNGGADDDEFAVYCDMDNGGWTEILPTRNITLGNYMEGDDTLRWFSDLQMSHPDIAWDVSASQLAALQAISSDARMRMDVLCQGVRVWRWTSTMSSAVEIYGKGAIFRSKTDASGVYWTHPSRHVSSSLTLEPIALSDGCAEDDINSEAKTEFLFSTRNARALPIFDIALEDHGHQQEHIGFSFAPVRFFTDLARPLGTTPSTPARSCADLGQNWHTAPQDGWYWIDAAGSGDPAYLQCDFTNGGWTGVPALRQIKSDLYFPSSGPSDHTWFSDLPKGYEIPYGISTSQLSALQAVATEAKQTLRVYCSGYRVWYGTTNAIPLDPAAAKFKSSSTTWVSSSNAQDRRPKVNYADDGCRFGLEGEASTLIHFETPLTTALPIVDVAIWRDGSSGRHFAADTQTAWFR